MWASYIVFSATIADQLHSMIPPMLLTGVLGFGAASMFIEVGSLVS